MIVSQGIQFLLKMGERYYLKMMVMKNINFQKVFYGQKKLISDILTFQVLQELIAVQENLLKKREILYKESKRRIMLLR